MKATNTNRIRNGKTRKVLKITFIVFSITLIFIILGGTFWTIWATKDVNLKNTDLSVASASTELFAADGSALEYFSRLKTIVPYEEISPNIINAFIALEDKRFYKHNGIDYVRVAGAAINNIKAGYFKEGGSTITQQLAKNAILSNEKTLTRKLKEAKLARQIEKEYNKEEILTKYLNTIYFGHSLYGIDAACARLFAKKPADLSIGESAMLAGIVKNPLKNSPLNSVANATTRRNLVLRLLTEQGYITEKQHSDALNEVYVEPTVAEKSEDGRYTEATISEAGKLLGMSEKQLITGGYKIYTYQDPKAQRLAEKAQNSVSLDADCDRLILLADNLSGGITAYVSSTGITPFALKRQPGSTIKPLISYAPALNANYISPSTPILDEKCDFYGYSPNNYKDSYAGWTNVRESVVSSANVVSVKLLNQIGVDYGKSVAKQLGLSFSEKDGLAAALGGLTDGVTPAELTNAYISLACGGLRGEIGFVKEIRDAKNRVIYRKSTAKTRVISEEAAYLMTDMLLDCTARGTAKKLARVKGQVASKTGTAGYGDGDENSDAWNLSYTPERTLCVWYGNLGAARLPSTITGGSYPTLTAKYMHENLPSNGSFTVPDGIISADIDTYATENSHILMLASENTPVEYKSTALFSADNVPEVSKLFDNALPLDFSAEIIENALVLSLSASENFVYHIYDQNGSLLGEIKTVEPFSIEPAYREIWLPAPEEMLTQYYVRASTTDGVFVAESERVIVICWT